MLRRPELCLLALLVPFAIQDPTPADAARYPAERLETCLRFYNLKGRLDADELRESASDASLEIVHGPMEAASRPSNSVVAVKAPADMKTRQIERALKKAGVKVEKLDVFLFRGRVEIALPTFGMDLEKIDYILGMSGEIRWADLVGEWTQFYCVSGKLDAEELEHRWVKLHAGFSDGEGEQATLGELVRDRFAWTLAAEVDEKRAKKLEKAIAKLDGIVAVRVQESALSVTVELAELATSSPGHAFGPEQPVSGSPPRATCFTNELWDLLEKEELAPSSE